MWTPAAQSQRRREQLVSEGLPSHGAGGWWSRVLGCGCGDLPGSSKESPVALELGKNGGCAPIAAMPPRHLLCPLGRGGGCCGCCVEPAHRATLSPGLSLGRRAGEEEQGGASQSCKGSGGEVEQPVGHLAVLAWCGAAAGRAWTASCEARKGMWDCVLGRCCEEWRAGPGGARG